ncbi:MAG: pilus assembly protein PilP [Deltaproteobacteria bacterium]|nr:pilus assembly protein PilP [Deltaproteobacteria bacterium]
MNTRTSLLALALVALGAAANAACTPDKALEAANSGNLGPSTPATASASATAAQTLAPPPVKPTEFAENDFVESDRNRDPFRTYVAIFQPNNEKRLVKTDRQVLLPQFSIDELKLVAIVTGGDFPRAMMLDPGNKGHVLKRGDFVGRPDIVHIGGANGADYQIHWRVDKVRDGDVVFIREDPAQPNIPPASRVISLHPEQDQNERLN